MTKITLADIGALNPTTNLPEPQKQEGDGIITQKDVEMAKASLSSPETSRIQSVPYDSMNFTNIYTDDIKQYTKYGVAPTRFFNWDEERAQNQGTGEKWINGLAKAGVTTLGAIAENTLGVAAGIGQMINGGRYYDNFVGKSVDKWNEAMRESFPNYRTQAEEQMSTGQKLLTANFWADTVANGFGYSLGSLATIWMTSGLGVVGRVAKANQLYNASKAVANGVKVGEAMRKGSKARGFVNVAAMSEMGLYMSLGEASVEARETQRNTYDSLVELTREQKINQGFSPELSESELKDIENASYAAANRNFLTQLPALFGTNLFMFGKHVAGFKSASKVNKDISFDASLRKVVNSVENQGKYRKAWEKLKPFGQGVLGESFQEGWQFATNIISSDFHTDKYFDAGTASFTSSLYKGIKETLGTQEGLESMLVGGLVGGGMAGVTSIIQKPYAQRQKQAELAKKIIDGGFLMNANNSMKNFSAQVKVALDMEAARKAGDIKKFKDAQYKLIQYSALAALESGGFDVFVQKLEDSKTLSDAEFAKMFGYDVETAIKDQTGGKSKSEVIKNVQDKLEEFKKVYENVNEMFPSAPRTQGLDRMRMSEEERKAEDAVFNKRANLRNELILSASGIENKMERLDSIQKQMKTLLTKTEYLNGIKLDTSIDSLLNPGEELLDVKDGKYEAKDEYNLLVNEFDKIEKQLGEKNALAALMPFRKLSEDYLSIFLDKATAIDRYNKLSSSKYFQDLFEETVKANQAEAEQVNKEKQTNEDIESAETSDQVRENTPPDASPNTKMKSKVKQRALSKEEQEAFKKYRDLNKGKRLEQQLKSLQHIAATQDLSPTERKGLETAITLLENRISKGKKVDKTASEIEGEEINLTADNIVRAENNENIQKNAPKKRPRPKRTPESEDKRRTDTKPTDQGELNIVSANNPNEVIQVGTYIDINGKEKPIYKVPVDENGRVIEPDEDQVTVTESVEKPRYSDSQVPVKRETFTQTMSDGTKVKYRAITRLDGSVYFQSIVQGESNFTAASKKLNIKAGDNITPKQRLEAIDTDATITLDKTEGYESVMNLKMFDRLTPDQQQRVDPKRAKTKPFTTTKNIPINKDLLLSENILNEQVEFEIIENDWWKSGEFRDPAFTEDWMHIPIYYKIGNAYVGKLEASVNEDRKAIVDRLMQGKPVVTKISSIKANNFNNAVDDTTAPYFYDPRETFGKDDDILLAFTTITKEKAGIIYQWTLSDVSDNKNKNNEIGLINVALKEVTPNAVNQIGIIIKKQNNPEGKARVSIASTANLNATAQKKTLDLLADKNYNQAKEIVANSTDRGAANVNPRYLEFGEFANGNKYIVYASPTLSERNKKVTLIRINENELTKALKATGNSTFNIVTETAEKFESKGKSNAKALNLNIAEDLAAFLTTKKYHVDKAKGNIDGMYTSPVTNIEYTSYQEYLFSSKELGDAAREEGSGYNAILTTDITKKGESMFNSPRVTFLKGNALGDTAQEVIDKKEFKETKFKIPTKPGQQTTLFEEAPVTPDIQTVIYKGNTYSVDFNAGSITNTKTGKVLEGGVTSPIGSKIVDIAISQQEAPVVKKKKFKRGTKSRDIVDKLGCPKKK